MARHVTGPGPRWQDLLLIYFQRQVVRIAKEGKAFTGKGIDTNRFALHAMRGEMGYRGVDIIHAKGQMTQPAGFRTTGAGWRKREREQLNYILAVERQIAFLGIALGAIKLTLQRKPQNIAIERFTAGVVGRNDGNMVNPFQTQHG